MPGINIILNKFTSVNEFTYENTEGLFHTSHLSISKSIPYSHYSLLHWETAGFVFIIEGFFYEWTAWKTTIEQFARRYSDATDKDALLAEYFADTDGEFVVVIHNKSQNFTCIVNDVLGRLPLYVIETNQRFVVSRNISFINSVQGLKPNTEAFLETLAFGFTLGTNTLYKDIERVPGGTIIEISDTSFMRRQYHVFNYEKLIHEHSDPQETITNVKLLFIEALRNRSKFADLNILGLSGGLDSRAVAGAFRLSGLSYKLITFSDKEGHARNDIACAKQIAEKQNLPLELVHLEDPQLSDFNKMFSHKYGLAGLDMTFLMGFYKKLVSLSTRPALYTGDGGDKVFPDLRPGTLLSTKGSIINYAVRFNSKMDHAIAARILGQDPNQLRLKVGDLMGSYPEAKWEQKYIHFIMHNRVSNWLVEGEDRNRCFLNTFTPFYHIRIFKSLMSVPLRFKRNFNLYGTFLKSISPETFDLPNANWGFNVSKKTSIRWIYFKQNLKNTSIGTKIKSWSKEEGNYITKLTGTEEQLFAELSSIPIVQQTFDVDFIRKLKSFSADNFLTLITLMKVASV